MEPIVQFLRYRVAMGVLSTLAAIAGILVGSHLSTGEPTVEASPVPRKAQNLEYGWSANEGFVWAHSFISVDGKLYLQKEEQFAAGCIGHFAVFVQRQGDHFEAWGRGADIGIHFAAQVEPTVHLPVIWHETPQSCMRPARWARSGQ